MIILDTDMCVEILRGNDQVIARRRIAGGVGISFMTVGELYYGAQRSARADHNGLLVAQFLLTVDCVHSTRAVMERFGLLKAELSRRGQMLPDADILVAATAFAQSGVLVTGNTQHFARFGGLVLEDWSI